MAAALSRVSSGRSKAPRLSSLLVSSSSRLISDADWRISSVAPEKREIASSIAWRTFSRIEPAAACARVSVPLSNLSASSTASRTLSRIEPAAEWARPSVSPNSLLAFSAALRNPPSSRVAARLESSSAPANAFSMISSSECIVVSICSERLTRPTDRACSASRRSSSVDARLDCAAPRRSEADASTLECSSKRPAMAPTWLSVRLEISVSRSTLPSRSRAEPESSSAAFSVEEDSSLVVCESCSLAEPSVEATVAMTFEISVLLTPRRSSSDPTLPLRLWLTFSIADRVSLVRLVIALIRAAFSARRRSVEFWVTSVRR